MKGDTRQIGEDYKEAHSDLSHLKYVEVHKGLVGVYIDETLISYIDGINGKLFYRGYPIRELVECSTFEEVSYLLIYGRLPSKSELENHKDLLIKERNIPDNILSILKSFPRNTTRIELLRTAISALSLYDPEDYVYTEEANIRKGLRIMAKMPTLIAFSHRIQQNQPLVEPWDDVSHAGNYYYMMTGEQPSKEFEDAFDKVLICHADHSINASTLSCRVTVSTLSDLYSGITSAIGTLRGPLHGGANEAVMRYMFNEVKRKDNVIPWAEKKLANKEKIMGFGHRVYKTWDPRGLIMRDISNKFWKKVKNGGTIDRIDCGQDLDHDHNQVDYIFDMTEILAEYMIENKDIYPNVDLYSAGLLHLLGIPMAAFTPLFAAARCSGWVAHAIEQLRDNKLIRPRLKYVGLLDRKYIPIEERYAEKIKGYEITNELV
ncbi:MAG: citrate synthase [Candidatus Lokiarchaeota archaeon]|nr:citrate synthase [Candidatus Lokiarchaeota archaeon]MBD3339054.1 citrate synthase [Candidatus Lokiarchaeota archaeon]